jgi:hypothetical protein
MSPAGLLEGSAARPVEQDSKFVLGGLEAGTLNRRQLPAGPVDVEGEHRHRGTERIDLPTLALLGGALERARYPARIREGEHPWLEVQGIAGVGDALRPLLALG